MLMFALMAQAAMARQAPRPEIDRGDQTLSPYFLVSSPDAALDSLPLKSTSAHVNISGVIADVTVTQVYGNQGSKPLEAIYVFPASTRAAVHGMKMTIGERVVEAKIRKREEARQEYEAARDAGKNASLLEQQRPNVFQMNVANIMPGDEVKVELRYTELVVPTDQVYEFMYPTVVGPRYVNKTEADVPASEHWTKNPYLRQGEPPTYAFDMKVLLAAGMPISEVTCPSHKVDTVFSGTSTAGITLDASEKHGGNRDFVLRYRLDGAKIQSGLLLFEGEKENFFLLMMQPPKRVTTADIPGREYVFIVDVSGSMHGFPLDVSKKLLRDLIGKLRASDRFNVILFAGASSVMAERSVSATEANIARAIAFIDAQQGGGGTELLPALSRALALPREDGVSRTLVIATDGYVSVEAEAFDLIRKRLGDANFFAFGIGSGVNRHLIEGIAHVGMGESFVVLNPTEAPEKAARFRELVASPVLTGVKVDFERFDTYDVEPPNVPDVLAERPVIVFGKWRGAVGGQVSLSGTSGSGRHRETMDVGGVSPARENGALRYLWARHRIQILGDYNLLGATDERVKEITDLGLTYNLLTAYTSFVAVDTVVRHQEGKPTTVQQPLPLPQGVSDLAVGGGMATQAMGAGSAGMGYRKSAPMLGTGRGGYGMGAADLAASPVREEAVEGLVRPPHPKSGKRPETVSVASLRMTRVQVQGGVTEQAVRKAFEARTSELESCFASNGYRGEVVMKLVIGADGQVKDVRVVSTTPKDASNCRWCLVSWVKTVLLDATSDGKEATVTITIQRGR